MITKLVLPKLGWTMEEGKIIKWLKQEGSEIKKREPILMIETDKVSLEIESPIDGFLRKIIIQENQTVPVGTVIAILSDNLEEKIPQDIESLKEVIEVSVPKKEETLETIPDQELQAKNQIANRIIASPRAKKLAREHNINLTLLKGTGPNGRIIERDVINFLNQEISPQIKSKTIPLEGIRKIIAKKMHYSLNEIPQLTYTSEIDMSEAIKIRKYLIDLYSSENVKITLTDIIIKAVIEAIKKYPIFNSVLDENKIVIKDVINLGVAVSTDRGLIVPVIHNASSKSIKEISMSVRELANKARNNTLNLDDVSGGTFTISNLGMFGIEIFTPIINPPESAILGVGKIIDKPIIKEGRLKICPMMVLSLTHDHRIMDGVDAAKFLQEIKMLLEDPYSLFKLEKPKSAQKEKIMAETNSLKSPKEKGALKFVEMLEKRGMNILGYKPNQMNLIGQHNPQLIANFARLHRDAMQEGALSTKTKALIALAIAVIVGCESCMKWHLVEAIEAGATNEEISETLGVTIYMGGGPALMHAETIADKLEELR
ncbi:MAG: 2-oxo acid dehydrogenase subunit E2 [Candidatus Helarchaeota archaeon]